MASVINAMSEAIKSLDYAATALMAPEGAFMRDTLAEMIEARQTVADMLAALERIVLTELNGGSAIAMRLIASGAIKAARGEA